jgi:hypothetical protein
MSIEGQRTWLALLEAELGRRTARAQWDAGADERARERFAAELADIAQRLGATAVKYPLDPAAMSPVEQLAVRLFLPKHLQPRGLPTEARILAPFLARRKARGGDP